MGCLSEGRSWGCCSRSPRRVSNAAAARHYLSPSHCVTGLPLAHLQAGNVNFLPENGFVPRAVGLFYIRSPNFSVCASKGMFLSAFRQEKQVLLLPRMFPWFGGAGSWPQLAGVVPRSREGRALAEDGDGNGDGQDWEGHRAPAAEVAAKN